MEEQETRAALVLMEAGTRWPSYAAEVRGRASSAIVEAQQPSEGMDEFSSRVVQRLQRMRGRKVTVPVAVMAVSERVDFEATTLRYRTARAVLGAISAHGEGELVIVAEETASDELRHELLAFAGALCDGLDTARINVRVRFASSSGVRPLVAAKIAAPEPLRESYA
jgi:hypothetical protein